MFPGTSNKVIAYGALAGFTAETVISVAHSAGFPDVVLSALLFFLAACPGAAVAGLASTYSRWARALGHGAVWALVVAAHVGVHLALAAERPDLSAGDAIAPAREWLLFGDPRAEDVGPDVVDRLATIWARGLPLLPIAGAAAEIYGEACQAVIAVPRLFWRLFLPVTCLWHALSFVADVSRVSRIASHGICDRGLGHGHGHGRDGHDPDRKR